MVEVVGTAPTSAMVITKFVYRRSWKTNVINIKGITIDSTTIMKLTKEQIEEIKKKGIEDFRGITSGIGTSFADNLVCSINVI